MNRRKCSDAPYPQSVAVDAWNRLHKSGCAVEVTLDDAQVVKTRTRSVAWMLSGHTGVILLESIPEYPFRGCYKLDRVRAVDPPPPADPRD